MYTSSIHTYKQNYYIYIKSSRKTLKTHMWGRSYSRTLYFVFTEKIITFEIITVRRRQQRESDQKHPVCTHLAFPHSSKCMNSSCTDVVVVFS